MTTLRYPRVLLKLSGEALAGDKGFGFDFESLRNFAREVKAISDMGVQVGMVIGGGNIVRGSQISKMVMDRVSADYMGMLGTVINALAFQDVLEREGWSPGRCVPHGGHQFALHLAAGLGLGGNESYPGVFEPFGGFADGVPSPRFSNGYAPLRNRFGMLVETHSWKDYPTRVRIT